MMVKQTRIVFSLEDIVTIRFICCHCRREVAQRLDQCSQALPRRCPWCQVGWASTASDIEAVNALLHVLATYPGYDEKQVEVQLEIDADFA